MHLKNTHPKKAIHTPSYLLHTFSSRLWQMLNTENSTISGAHLLRQKRAPAAQYIFPGDVFPAGALLRTF